MIDTLTDAINRIVPGSRIRELLGKKKRVELRGFTGSSVSFLLKSLHAHSSHILVITPDIEKATAYASDLQELTGATDYLQFPPTRRKPYDDQMVVDLSVKVQRTEVLEKLKSPGHTVIFTSAGAICEKLIPAGDFHANSIRIKNGDAFPPESLREQLSGQGYSSVKFVDEPGEFAIRGGIFDVFPYSGEYPVRLEFFGDEIDSIREFDPDSQRSVAFLDETRFVPNSTFDNKGPKQTLFEYLPQETTVFLNEPDLILDQISRNMETARQLFNKADNPEWNAPHEEFLSPEDYLQALENRPVLVSGSFSESVGDCDERIDLNASPHPQLNGSFKLLRAWLRENTSAGLKTLILCSSQTQCERFEELLGEPGGELGYRLMVFSLHEGFLLKEPGLALLTDHQIFNRYHRPKVKRRKKVKGGISFKELRDLNVDDYVVHVDYGIGKFAGFKKIEVKGAVQEAAVLRYQDNSILYVNVSSLHKLQKYSGKEGTAPRVTRLGSGEWARKKSRTRKKVKDIARELIQLYAKRKTLHAHSFSPDISWQTEMEARFEFEETPDQMSAIEAVKRDMESGQPMDRLICGDVGFGKTEVAIRAAFKAVMDQKQVAVLVPTTLLADQHYKTFSERLEEFPLTVEVLSRFRSKGEQKQILEKLKKGQVDILIGTHRLVSKDVEFRDLGLLVIDEEQRFGVSVKEKLKEYRTTVDVLTLTATPIPRTMQFSLMGARDLSLIHTPPANRQPVYTEIHSFNQEVIRDAILHEFSRGGQVFFIHNRVKNIEEVAGMVRQLAPNVRVKFGHGQMPSARLEKIVHDFYNHKFDVLISTNIVENGIDISNANTILINNANWFGLSELHQLRGRVGRSQRKAYCYLLTPPIQTLTSEARKRLTALEEFSDLGSGFNIAMRDLDIRGAGDILGAEQSGFINELGFEMYTKILDDAVREIKEEEYSGEFDLEPARGEYPDTQVEFDFSALLESKYVSDNVERLNLYRKLSDVQSEQQMNEWREELEDRFGPLPETAENLLLVCRIKFHASRLLLVKVTIRAGRMWLLCPKSETPTGNAYFDTGLFQKQLSYIQQLSGEEYELVQKKNSVRIVIPDIPGLSAALAYLKKLREETVPVREVPV